MRESVSTSDRIESVGDEVGLLALLHAGECGDELSRSRIGQLEEPALAARQSISRPGVFLQEPAEGGREKRQRLQIAAPEPVQVFRIRGAERAPGALREHVLRLVDRTARLEERRQFVRRELAQSLERGVPRKRSDADEADGLRGRHPPPNPGQELNQVQLIEQVVLKAKMMVA